MPCFSKFSSLFQRNRSYFYIQYDVTIRIGLSWWPSCMTERHQKLLQNPSYLFIAIAYWCNNSWTINLLPSLKIDKRWKNVFLYELHSKLSQNFVEMVRHIRTLTNMAATTEHRFTKGYIGLIDCCFTFSGKCKFLMIIQDEKKLSSNAL